MAEPPIPYRVAPMTLADIDSVMEIERLSHSAAWPASAYRHELEGNTLAHYFVLFSEPPETALPATGLLSRLRAWLGRPADRRALLGYGGFWMMADESHISTIAVHPEWRGHGLGELMLIELIEAALRLEAILVTLEVRVSNKVAQGLYEKYGFEIVGTRRRYYRDNNEDAHIMTVEEVLEPPFRELLDHRWRALRARLAASGEEGSHE